MSLLFAILGESKFLVIVSSFLSVWGFEEYFGGLQEVYIRKSSWKTSHLPPHLPPHHPNEPTIAQRPASQVDQRPSAYWHLQSKGFRLHRSNARFATKSIKRYHKAPFFNKNKNGKNDTTKPVKTKKIFLKRKKHTTKPLQNKQKKKLPKTAAPPPLFASPVCTWYLSFQLREQTPPAQLAWRTGGV